MAYISLLWLQEFDSRAVDHIQAADISAGWAKELLDLNGERALPNTFERVVVNDVQI